MAKTLNIIKALFALLTIGGGAFGGFSLMDNASEDLPKTVASRAVGAVAKNVLGGLSGAGPSAGGASGIVQKLAETAASATGALPPVEEPDPDWVRTDAQPDHGARARASSNYGSASCDCTCGDNESFGEKMVRMLPFLTLIPGV